MACGGEGAEERIEWRTYASSGYYEGSSSGDPGDTGDWSTSGSPDMGSGGWTGGGSWTSGGSWSGGESGGGSWTSGSSWSGGESGGGSWTTGWSDTGGGGGTSGGGDTGGGSWTTGWSDTGGGSWSGSGGTGSGTSTTGWSDTGGDDDSTTGCEAPEEEPVECCVSFCDEGGSDTGGDSGGDTDGSTSSCGTKSAFPGAPTEFNCPVHLMPYNCGKPGCNLFDCDDYAYACKMWSDANGYNTCQFEFHWKDAAGKSQGHVINPVEFDYPASDVLHKWCLIEPQDNTSYGCWIQGPGDPVIPDNIFTALCTAWNAAPNTCTRGSLWCTGTLCTNAGEACFTTIPSVCDEFKNKTGICVDTWKKP